jgi:hypothetical protein
MVLNFTRGFRLFPTIAILSLSPIEGEDGDFFRLATTKG